MEFLLQVERQLAELRCVPTNAFGGKDGIDRDLDGWNGCETECLAPTDDASIGGDRDDQRIDCLQSSLAPDCRASRSARHKRDPQWDGFHSGNLHCEVFLVSSSDDR
jgi:hypothetical protein